MILAFLLVFIIHTALVGMEQEKENELHVWYDFQCASSTKAPDIKQAAHHKVIPETFAHHYFPQWVEITLQEGTANRYKAASKTIAWTTAENHQRCYYFNKKFAKSIREIAFNKPIELFDISSNGEKLIVVTGKNFCTIWDLKEHKQIQKDTLTSENKTPIITAVQFIDSNSCLAAADDHTFTCFACDGTSQKYFALNHHDPTVALSIDNVINRHHCFFAYHASGDVHYYHMMDDTEYNDLIYKLDEKIPPFNAILSANDKNWIAQDENKGLYCFTLQSGSHFIFDTLNYCGTLVGKTYKGTILIFEESEESTDELPKLINFSLNTRRVLDKIPLARNTKPVPQKFYSSRIIPKENWLPRFLIYQDNPAFFTLLKKKSPSPEQSVWLAQFAEASKAQNHATINDLLNHEIFKNLSPSTQESLKAMYAPEH